MPAPRFLIIDDNPDSRMLLAKSLLRKHPEGVVLECQNGDTAAELARSEPLAAIVAHRTFDYDAEALVALLRQASPAVPIVMVSGYDHSAHALPAGADAFLHYDRWLNIGAVVDEAIVARQRLNAAPAPKAEKRLEARG